MAATTAAGSTFVTTAGTTTTPAVTATPAVGDLIVIVAAATGVAPAAPTDNNSGGAGSYVQVGTTRTGFSTTGNLSMWVRTALIASATSTVFTSPQNGSTGGGLIVYRISGMLRTGSLAVRQSAGQSTGTSGTTPAPALAAAALTSNPLIGAVANAGTAGSVIAQRSSPAYTEDADLGYTVPTTGLEGMHIDSGETASTITWGGTSGSAFASIVAEFDTTALPAGFVGIPAAALKIASPTLTGTFAAFTPNEGSCYLVCATTPTDGGGTATTFTVSWGSGGGGNSWGTQLFGWQLNAFQAFTSYWLVYIAPGSAPGSSTITVTGNAHATNGILATVTELTGVNVASPLGATATDSTTSHAAISLTPTFTGSLGFALGCDRNEAFAVTANASTNVLDSFAPSGTQDASYVTNANTTAGVAVSIGSSTGAPTGNVQSAIEIKLAAAPARSALKYRNQPHAHHKGHRARYAA